MEHSEAGQLMSSKCSRQLPAAENNSSGAESLPFNGLRAASKGKPGAVHEI
jgi:hypothetical protein